MKRYFLTARDRALNCDIGVAYHDIGSGIVYWGWHRRRDPGLLDDSVPTNLHMWGQLRDSDNEFILRSGRFIEIYACRLRDVINALDACTGVDTEVRTITEVQVSRVPPEEQALLVIPPPPPKTNHKIGVPKGKLP